MRVILMTPNGIAIALSNPLPVTGVITSIPSITGSVQIIDSGSGAVFPVAGSTGDNYSNPSSSAIKTLLYAWDGSAWDRVTKTDANSKSAADVYLQNSTIEKTIAAAFGTLGLGIGGIDGSSNFQAMPIDTSGADAVSNTKNRIPENSALYGFNGTSWDRLRSDITNGLDVDVTRSALPTGAATAANQLAAGHTVTVLNGKTILSAGGSVASSGNNTLISAGSNKLKVFAFSLSTTSTTAVTCIFQSGAGGTELWRVILQAPTNISTGANLAVSPPAWLFATSSATLLNLNLSAAQTVHWSASYFDEA